MGIEETGRSVVAVGVGVGAGRVALAVVVPAQFFAEVGFATAVVILLVVVAVCSWVCCLVVALLRPAAVRLGGSRGTVII